MIAIYRAYAIHAIAARRPDLTVAGGGDKISMLLRYVPVGWHNVYTREIRTGGIKSAQYNRGGYKPRISLPGGIFRVIRRGVL